MKVKSSLYVAVALFAVLATLVAGCGGPAATTTPPTTAPVAKAPTTAPVAAPTTAPVAAPTTAPTAAATKAAAPTTAAAATAPVAAAATAPAAPKPTTPPANCTKLSGMPTAAAGTFGAPDKPIVITFVPSVDVSLITKGGQAMADCLSKMTGLTYKVEVGTSEAASIEAMGGNKAQMGFLNTFSILLAKQKYDVDVALVAQRKYGVLQKDGTYTAFDFDPDKALAGQLASFYKPEYFAGVNTGIKSLADVKGKRFCFTTASSTSGGIIPRAQFKAMGIDPDKDMQSTYAGGHDKAAIAVYNGDCDAGVAFMDVLTDAPTNLQGKFPDLLQKVKVFAVGDRIPNDGLQFVKGFDPNLKQATLTALLAMMKDPGGNAVVKSIYNYDAFEQADFNKYYAPFQDMLKKAGIDVAQLVKQ